MLHCFGKHLYSVVHPIASTSKALRSDMGRGDYEEMEYIMTMYMEYIMLICQDRTESVS